MKKILFLAIFIVLTLPTVSYASWWNPFSWSLFKQSNAKHEIIRPISTSTQNLINSDSYPNGMLNLQAENTHLKNELKKYTDKNTPQKDTAIIPTKTSPTKNAQERTDCTDLKKHFVDNYIPNINDLYIAKRKDEGAVVTKLKNQEINALSNAGKLTASESSIIFNKYLLSWQNRLVEIEQERKNAVKSTYQKILAETAPSCKDDLIVEDLKGATDVKFVQPPTVQTPSFYYSYPAYQYTGTINPSTNYSSNSEYKPLKFETPTFPSAVPPRIEIRIDEFNTDFGSIKMLDGNTYDVHCYDGLNGGRVCNKI